MVGAQRHGTMTVVAAAEQPADAELAVFASDYSVHTLDVHLGEGVTEQRVPGDTAVDDDAAAAYA